MTESYSSNSVLFKYYINGAEIPTNFNLMQQYYYTPKDYDREIRNWITQMPKGSTYNAVVSILSIYSRRAGSRGGGSW